MSRAFTITFILFASFIFLSMFVGVMIIHTEVGLCVHGRGSAQVRQAGLWAQVFRENPELAPS